MAELSESRAARKRSRRGSSSSLWAWIWIGGALVAAAVVLSMMFVEPPPPYRVTIAAGDKSGAYYRFAREYAGWLARDGLTVDVMETAGSVENLELLGRKDSGVDLAIVQSGVAADSMAEEFEALGSLYREPLWVFHTGDAPISRLSELAGKRIGVGAPGSGTQAVARRLLEANDVREGDQSDDARFVEREAGDAADDLAAGRLDAAFFAAAFEAEYIQRLLREESVHPVSFAQQEAYRRRFRYLAPVTLPASVLDLGRNLPARDLALLAPTAMLVVRHDFHPALIPPLLGAAQRVHGRGNVVSEPREFPSPYYCDLPIHDYARRFYTSGQPMLQKLLPFWLASLVDRAKLMIIPMAMLMMPLFRAAPPLIRWRTRRRVYRWYRALRRIDQAQIEGLTPAEAEAGLARLHDLEDQVTHVEVPLSYMKEFYHLRLHIALLREQLMAQRDKREPSTPT